MTISLDTARLASYDERMNMKKDSKPYWDHIRKSRARKVRMQAMRDGGASFMDIGKRFKVTRQRVQQILSRE